LRGKLGVTAPPRWNGIRRAADHSSRSSTIGANRPEADLQAVVWLLDLTQSFKYPTSKNKGNLLMSSALYISIKDKPKDLDTFMSGKALASAWEALNPIADKLKLPTMDKLCNNAWKAPEKGLSIFESYLAYITEYPDVGADPILTHRADPNLTQGGTLRF